MRQGYIYVITNKVNGKQYVGQTSRNIQTRFEEHWSDKRSTSAIHKAIEKYGILNFEIQELEQVDLNQLDEREQYWIQKLDTYKNGYNKNIGGNQSFSKYKQVLVIENNFIFDSAESMANDFVKLTDWSLGFLKEKIRKALKNNEEFLGYHLKYVEAYKEEQTDITDVENWIKTLNIKYQGQHIYCKELDKEFETIGEASRYLVENKIYQGDSKAPIQTVITLISKNVNNKSSSACGLTFYRAPGTTKNKGSEEVGVKKPVYCPELDKEFESGIETAKYFIDNGIWTGIKLKTAKLRISDVLRGVFPSYKGYTFKYI